MTEQVAKGNIAIIKHTDNGETQIETPENGAEFAVYLKAAGSYDSAKASERDYLTCDENGFAQTKDMPYGIYTVHQVSGWEGSKLMPDFDVFISQNGATYRYLINNASSAVERLQERYDRLKEKCQPFLQALEHFPKLVEVFVEKVKELFSIKEAQERKEREDRAAARKEQSKHRRGRNDWER